jgi:lipoprotein-anchoring transpeptidase ErfK/SrfK
VAPATTAGVVIDATKPGVASAPGQAVVGHVLVIVVHTTPHATVSVQGAGIKDVGVLGATKTISGSRGIARLKVVPAKRGIHRTRVAVGRPGMETPRGSFYVRAEYHATEAALGAYAFETSAYSKLSDWPGGGIIGIHGTPQPQLLGSAVSHGCIRVSNAAALTLGRLVPVGTAVTIVR